MREGSQSPHQVGPHFDLQVARHACACAPLCARAQHHSPPLIREEPLERLLVVQRRHRGPEGAAGAGVEDLQPQELVLVPAVHVMAHRIST
jgi:hypothetical protein